jgi:hypothetical protein
VTAPGATCKACILSLLRPDTCFYSGSIAFTLRLVVDQPSHLRNGRRSRDGDSFDRFPCAIFMKAS